jgi:hypothetical protein
LSLHGLLQQDLGDGRGAEESGWSPASVRPLASPGQGRGDRVRPRPVLQRRRLRPLILLNLLFLGCIAFLPYPTSLLSAAADQTPATVFYAVSIAAAGLAEATIWLYAIHIHELALPGVPPVVYRWALLRILAGPVVFLLSIPVAITQPVLAQFLWLLALFSALVLRRLEPPEPEPKTAERDDPPGSVKGASTSEDRTRHPPHR